jgi:hypothetical protein
MGNIYSALRELQALKAGTSNVTGVYVGTDLIWPLITPTPTITPTSTFTPTPTSTPTITPTSTITPTVTSTNTPTPTITPYPVCPQQLEITSTNEIRIDVGTYTRATIASGTTFDYGYFDQTQFVIGRAPDGNYYPIYQYISGDTNTLYRGFSGSTDLGWYGREEFLNPLFNPPPYIGGQRTFGSDYITVGDARFFKSGSNTGFNPGFEPEDVTIYIQYSIVCPTPTPTVTTTNTMTPTNTPTVTPTNTITPTVTRTVTPTNTPTVTPTNTQTPTSTFTPTPTITPTNTMTPTVTRTVTPTPSSVVPTLNYITASTFPNPTFLTTITFSSINWSSPGFIVVAVAGGRSDSILTIASVTIGGVTATALERNENLRSTCSLFGATVTGNSGNIVITWDVGPLTCGIGVWRVNNLQSTTPVSTAKYHSTTVLNTTLNLTKNNGTNVVICAAQGNGGTTGNFTSSTTPRNYFSPFTTYTTYYQGGFSETSLNSGTYSFQISTGVTQRMSTTGIVLQ